MKRNQSTVKLLEDVGSSPKGKTVTLNAIVASKLVKENKAQFVKVETTEQVKAEVEKPNIKPKQKNTKRK